MTDLPALRRPRADAIAAGVCAGIAQRLRIDPIIVRVLVVALVFAGGFGIALYFAAILTIPREGAEEAVAQRLLPFLRTWPTAAATLAVAAVIMACFGIMGGWRGFAVLPLAGLAILIFAILRNRSKPVATPAPDPTPFERAADAWQQRLDAQRGLATPFTPTATPFTPAQTATAAMATTPGQEPPTPARVTPPKRRRGHGWAIALGLSAVGVGTLAALDAAGYAHNVPAAAYSAAILLSLGVGLLASVRAKRPRGMVPAAFLAAIATVFLFLNPDGSHTVRHAVPAPAVAELIAGTDHTSYPDAASLPATISLGPGSQTIDLSAITLAGVPGATDVHTSISLPAGDLTILLPAAENIQVDWDVLVGKATIGIRPDHANEDSGLGVRGTDSSLPHGAQAPALHLTASLWAGDLTVVAR